MFKIWLINMDDLDERCSFGLEENGLCVFPRTLCKDLAVNSQGFYSYRRTSLFPNKSKLISVFTDGKSIRMGIQSKLYNLSDPLVIVRRKRVFVGAKEFILTRGDQVEISFRYWDLFEVEPSFDDGDIFDYAERVTKSPRSKLEFLEILNAMRAGVLEKIMGNLDEYLRDRLGDSQ